MNVLVRVGSGLIEGAKSADGVVVSFKGVPYARPPVGPLRWRPPQAVAGWDGVRPAVEFGAACIQPPGMPNMLVYGNENGVTKSEDCLTLNVYTAAADPAEHRPVIVWFHHGGFMAGWSGAPMYDGSGLARSGAVVVTVNYRLGRLGFLAHPALSAETANTASGNYGLMDQIAALQWVRDNIAEFGGDPGCVTIYGISAGSASVSLHMTSPQSKGLFHRAIGGSGALFGPVRDNSEAGDCFQTLDAAERLGASLMAEAGARTADELRDLPPETILKARGVDFHRSPRGVMDTIYPILDGHVLPTDSFTTFSKGLQNDVPLITGSNRHERTLTPHNLDTQSYLEDAGSIYGPFRDRFLALFPAGPDGLTGSSSRDANSDRFFSWQNLTWARMQARYGKAPVYYYNFTHEPPVPAGRYAEQMAVNNIGAFHSAELPYVFRNLEVRDWPWGDEDRALMETLSGYWLNFARTGNPNGNGRPDWPALDMAAPMMMDFSAKPAARPGPATERFVFWDDFYAWFRQSSETNPNRQTTTRRG